MTDKEEGSKENSTMEQIKERFYKTPHEAKLKLAIDKIYNDYIGGDENAMMDGEEYNAWTEETLIDQITKEILSETNYLDLEDTWEVLEAKHVRFMGEKRVREIVEHRVQVRHSKEGKWAWEK